MTAEQDGPPASLPRLVAERMADMTDRPMPSEAFGTASYLIEAHPDAPQPQPLWVELTECYKCGAVVHDSDAHTSWHAWLYKMLGCRGPTPDDRNQVRGPRRRTPRRQAVGRKNP